MTKTILNDIPSQPKDCSLAVKSLFKWIFFFSEGIFLSSKIKYILALLLWHTVHSVECLMTITVTVTFSKEFDAYKLCIVYAWPPRRWEWVSAVSDSLLHVTYQLYSFCHHDHTSILGNDAAQIFFRFLHWTVKDPQRYYTEQNCAEEDLEGLRTSWNDLKISGSGSSNTSKYNVS